MMTGGKLWWNISRWAAMLLAGVLCAQLCGCAWMDGSYVSIKPHQEAILKPGSESVEVSSYLELRSVLVDMVESGLQKGVIYISGVEEQQIRSYMDVAINHAAKINPIGAYAVEQIHYEIGNNPGKRAVAIDISYVHNRLEILRIQNAENMEQAATVIAGALEQCNASVIMRINSFDNVDFPQLVQDYVQAHPDKCMEVPQVTVVHYPNVGFDRVVELTFSYQTSREVLRSMQELVQPVFASARLYISADAPAQQKYSQLYSFLMERFDYVLETSITPSYSLLCHGVGDSRAFASTYAAMCSQSGLECHVVSGTRAGEPWFWNLIRIDDLYYHVDLIQCSRSGGFQTWTDGSMSGYVWDYFAYSAPEAGEPAA